MSWGVCVCVCFIGNWIVYYCCAAGLMPAVSAAQCPTLSGPGTGIYWLSLCRMVIDRRGQGCVLDSKDRPYGLKGQVMRP